MMAGHVHGSEVLLCISIISVPASPVIAYAGVRSLLAREPDRVRSERSVPELSLRTTRAARAWLC